MILRVIGAGNEVLWEGRRSPGAGRFSTDRWPGDRLVADSYAVPPDVLAAAERVQVGVYRFGTDDLLAPHAGTPGSYLTIEVPTR